MVTHDLFFLFNLAGPGLSCGLWDLGPWPGVKRRPPALRATGPPGKPPHDLLITTLASYKTFWNVEIAQLIFDTE